MNNLHHLPWVISRSEKTAQASKWLTDLQIVQMLVLKTLKWNIAHVWDMLWFTDLTCKVYKPQKIDEKIQ